MVSLVNIGKDGKNRINRNNVDKWSFSLIPVEALIDKERGCCFGHISSKILNQYKFDPKNPKGNYQQNCQGARHFFDTEGEATR